jgi:hypothetical protein
LDHGKSSVEIFARTRKPFLPLLGERAGVRAGFFTLTLLFGFVEMAGVRCFVFTHPIIQ